jgi:RNA polymerase sigma factor (sigma-70 family)
MSFPETRHTLIQRLVASGTEGDWRQFLQDYWGPVCRFAARRGCNNLADAEDVASQTFQALLTNQLLARWMTTQSAKLRTLLCAVVRNVISNRFHGEQRRQRLIQEHLDQGGDLSGLIDAPVEQIDAFYAAWVDEVLARSVERLLEEYLQADKGDYFRVLHGRICEEMTMNDVALALGIKITSAENYFKAARKRLGALLEEDVRAQVARYSAEGTFEEEFTAEWTRLGEHLAANGGLEAVVRRANDASLPPANQRRQARQIDETLSKISSYEPR